MLNRPLLKLGGGGGGWPTQGRLCPKGVPFSGFRSGKGRDFTHFGLYNGPNGLTDAFYGCEKLEVEKTFWFCDLFLFYSQCINSRGTICQKKV